MPNVSLTTSDVIRHSDADRQRAAAPRRSRSRRRARTRASPSARRRRARRRRLPMSTDASSSSHQRGFGIPRNRIPVGRVVVAGSAVKPVGRWRWGARRRSASRARCRRSPRRRAPSLPPRCRWRRRTRCASRSGVPGRRRRCRRASRRTRRARPRRRCAPRPGRAGRSPALAGRACRRARAAAIVAYELLPVGDPARGDVDQSRAGRVELLEVGVRGLDRVLGPVRLRVAGDAGLARARARTRGRCRRAGAPSTRFCDRIGSPVSVSSGSSAGS